MTSGGRRKPFLGPCAPPRSRISASMTFRHTFASRLAMEAVDLMTIRELMGHKTMAMTLRYSHLSPGHRRTAIERLVSRQTTDESAPAAGAE
jgi:site-specific recombinase XerD